MTNHHTSEQWIFAGVFEQPAISRITREVYTAADRLVVPCARSSRPMYVAVQLCGLRIPRGGGRQTLTANSVA